MKIKHGNLTTTNNTQGELCKIAKRTKPMKFTIGEGRLISYITSPWHIHLASLEDAFEILCLSGSGKKSDILVFKIRLSMDTLAILFIPPEKWRVQLSELWVSVETIRINVLHIFQHFTGSEPIAHGSVTG